MSQSETAVVFLGINNAGRTDNLLPHSHDFFEINYTIRGNMKIKVGNRLIHCEPQDFILIPPKMDHCLYASGDEISGGYVLRFTASQEFKAGFLRENTILRFRDYDSSLYFLVSELYRLHSSGKMLSAELSGAYLSIVLMYMRQGKLIDISDTKAESDLIEQSVNYINENFLTKPITVNELAELVNMSPAHFSRLFHNRVGMPPMRYLIEVKMNYAKKLLIDEKMSIKEIAETLHYSDQLYFSRVFTNYNGVSPKKYRQGSR